MFNKKICIDNIYILAKEKKLKIGEMEEKAGVSKGYLSRINKEDSTTNPSIDFLVSIAEQLNVSLDYLLGSPLSAFSKTELFVMEFLDQLLRETDQENLEWVLQVMSVLTVENGDPVDNPLIDVIPNYSEEFNVNYQEHRFTSRFYDNADISGDCYYCRLVKQRGARVFLMRVRYHSFGEQEALSIIDYLDVLEMYIYREGTISPICSTAYVKREIANTIWELYETIKSTASRLGLTREAKEIMQSFLNEGDPNES